MKLHQNLFDYYDSKSEVYGKLQSDYLRDSKQIRWLSLVINILIIVGIFIPGGKWQIILFITAAFCSIQLILIFIDQSNRNFLMHTIDWIESDKPNQ